MTEQTLAVIVLLSVWSVIVWLVSRLDKVSAILDRGTKNLPVKLGNDFYFLVPDKEYWRLRTIERNFNQDEEERR